MEGSPSLSRTDVEAPQLSKNRAATQVEDNSLSEGNVSENTTGSFTMPNHNLTSNPIDRVQSKPKRSSRVSKLFAKLNDYVVDSKLKYGLEKTSALDPKWVEAINDEMDALYRNHTWTIVELPKGRKAIGLYASPLQSHFKAAFRVLRYLKVPRNSVSGFVVVIGNCPVSWKRKDIKDKKKQKPVKNRQGTKETRKRAKKQPKIKAGSADTAKEGSQRPK
ncbi:hypothetical protein Tco_0396451 [Tanacetum coccineum]